MEINIFKRIWNFFFGKKPAQLGCDGLPYRDPKKQWEKAFVNTSRICPYCQGQKQIEWKGKMTNCPSCEGSGNFTEWIERKPLAEPETIREKLFKPHTQLFRKHQLQGKVYRLGKSRFRIKKKIGQAGEKLKYHIELI